MRNGLVRIVVVGVALALLAAPAVMAAPGGPSGDGIQPVETAGNPDCVTVLGIGAKEVKDDSPGDSTVGDGTLSVTYDLRNTPDGEVLDFSGATTGIDAVIVKGGDNANVYTYPFDDVGDTGLHAPINSSNGRFHDVSHVSFCYAGPTCTAAAVTLNPANVTTTYGDGNVTFTATASGNPAPTVKWQVSTAGSAGPWTDVPGATTTTLTVAQPTVADSGKRYRAVFTNACSTVNTTDALLTVNRRPVTGAFTAANKVYDGTTAATITGRSLVSGVIPGDDVSLTGGSATFGDKTVGTGKPVTGTGFGLGGAAAANYTLTSVSNTTANITPKPLTGTCTVADKVYDATTNATVTGSSLGAGVVAGDVVSLNGAGASSAFADPDVGDDKPVPCNGLALAGGDAGNYTLTISPTTADITPRPLTGTCTAANKVYDGTTAATITGSSLQGTIAGDAVSLNGAGASAAFADPDVGNGKPVACNGFSLAGADAANYTLTMSPTTASITPKPLVGTCAVADKDFDGNASATVTGTTLTGIVPGEVVTLTGGTAEFGDSTPGRNKPVDCKGYTLGGAGAGNYTLTVRDTQATIRRPPAPAPIDECLRRPVFAFIRGGKQTAKVVFFLEGEKIATVTKPDKQRRFGVNIDRRTLDRDKTHILRATVYFTKASKRKPVKLIVVKLRPCLENEAAEEIAIADLKPGACVKKPFLVYVKGDTISTVTFSLNGRRLRKVSVADGSGRYKVRIRPSQLRPGRNVIRAKIVFIGTSKTRTRTLKTAVKPC